MIKSVALLMLGLALSISVLTSAETTSADGARLDGFSIVLSKVPLDGEYISIEMTALYDTTDAVRDNVFFATSFNEEDGGHEKLLIERYVQYNSLGHHHNICFLSLITQDGFPFLDNSRDWHFMAGQERQHSDGAWWRTLSFDGYTMHGEEGTAVVEFHYVTEDITQYTGEPQSRLLIELPRK